MDVGQMLVGALEFCWIFCRVTYTFTRYTGTERQPATYQVRRPERFFRVRVSTRGFVEDAGS
jgi:hypothetical protein